MKEGRENKPHIGIFGRCNTGKSSLLNFITGSDTAIVSPMSGTTTDVVRKSFEIQGFAPVIFIDTAGLDDTSELGTQRISRTLQVISQIDLALVVFQEWSKEEENLLSILKERSIPYILIYNNIEGNTNLMDKAGDIAIDIKSNDPEKRKHLFDLIKRALPEKSYKTASMFEGLVNKGDVVLLVCPVDNGAPAGRLILPQVQALRELLDKHCIAITVQLQELSILLAKGVTPKLIVTDSQVLKNVIEIAPQGIQVTSFSILLAAAKGDMALYTEGLEYVDSLKDGDRILIAENCLHQASCDDIGRVKIPKWLETYCGCSLDFTFIPGLEPLPIQMANYALMIQCGGCMATRSQVQNRIRTAASQGVAVTNYGMLIRKIRGGDKIF